MMNSLLAMKTLSLLAAFLTLSQLVHAVDTTPPTLEITHTWIEKQGAYSRFKMFLDPQDETELPGQIGTIFFRSALNTSTIPASQPWQMMPWLRSEPFDIGFNCTSCVIELRVKDSAGNYSPVQKRTFSSPFPYSPEPNQRPQLALGEQFTGASTECRGLFVGRFDGVGSGDDVLQVDRPTGNITVHRMINSQPIKHDVSFSLPANTIEDSASADFDTDSRADLAIIANGALTLYHNDGLDGDGVVQFGAQTVSLTGTGITTFNNIAVGDVTGDGKLDIVVSGTDSGGATRIGWLIANATWQYDSSNGAPAPSGTSPGKLALGDMNGDGSVDVVMVDAANNQMIVFKNKGAGVIAGDGEADTNYQPVLILTGLGQAGPNNPTIPFIPAPARALTVGDVTGDGRPDIIVVFVEFIYDASPNDGHVFQKWRLYENRGNAGFRPFTDVELGRSALQNVPDGSQPVIDVSSSDVMLMELNNDRFPEMLFTDYYHNSVKIIHFSPLLGAGNFLTTLDDGGGRPELDELDYLKPADGVTPVLVGPCRLAKGKHKTSSGINSLAIAFTGSNHVRWDENVTRASTKTYDLQGGTVTDYDSVGTEGANGLRTYNSFVGEYFTNTITAINNSASPLTSVFLDITMPTNCSIDTSFADVIVPEGDPTPASSWFFVTISGVKYLRWVVTVPANDVVIRTFRLKILNGTIGSLIAPTAYLRNAATLASAPMPKVLMSDPVQFRATVETESDNSGGDTAHAEEWIAYRMRMTNLGGATVSAKELLFTLPSNTTHLDHSADSVLGVTPVIKVGGTTYSPWKPNATIALNQKVVGSNNHVYQCTANGISALTEPAWPLGANATITDNNVIWKHIGTTPVAISSFTWSTFELPPDDPMTVELENEKTIEVRVKIKDGLANGTKIARGLTTFTRSDGTKQTAPAWTTTLLNPLEITLSQNKTIARPGELVRYTLTVHNWAYIALGNCKVVDTTPPGMVFVESGASDGADSGVSGGTGNFSQFPGFKKNNLTPTSSPVALDVLGIITWNLGTIPARATRNIVFDLQVQHDVPDSYNYGTDHPTVDLSNFSYNFVGNNSLGKRLFAVTPTLGATTGSDQGAASLFLVAPNTARHTLLSGDDPIDAPRLYTLKSFSGDGTQQVGGETQHILVNDSTVTTDAVGTFGFVVGNVGAGDARNVTIRDYLPTNMNFTGFMNKFGNPVSNFTGYRFYDAANKELLFGDPFNDTNGSGFADAGETYTDANGNKKFDGFTASQVRWMDIAVGDLAGGSSDVLGTGGYFSYRAQATTATAGTIITSTAGGMSGVKDGVNYTATTGYHVRADNLRFPINGSPEKLKIIIVPPAVVTYPVQTVKSRSSISDTESAEITMPYEITGATGLTLSNLFMDLDIPKGYQVLGAKVIGTSGATVRSYVPGAGGNTITVTTNGAGVTHIQYPLDGQRIAFPTMQIGVNPATKSALLTSGVTTKPLTYAPKITGKYVKAPPPPPPGMAAARGYAAAAAAAPPPAPVPLGAVSTFGTLPTLADSTKDSRIFVGRSAPVSVKKGDSFQYVIFLGNLTSVGLGRATVTFKVPEGCIGVNVSQYTYNAYSSTASLGQITPTAPFNAANKIWTWAKPLIAGTPITLEVANIIGAEAGAFFFTCAVLDSFTGDRIDDNSVIFDVANACAKTPGPIGIAVRAGNETASSASITQRALDGLQIRSSNGVTSAIGGTFSPTSASNHITFGGPDVMQMNNGVGMVPLATERVFIIGPPSAVSAPPLNLLLDNGRVRIAVGPGNSSTGIKLVNPPTYSSGLLLPNALLLDMQFSASANIVAAGGGNIVAAGGGNIVAAGGGNLQGASIGATIKMPDGSTAVVVADLVHGGVKLVGQDGASIVAAGGGNIVAAGGGNIVAAGGGNVVSNDGAGIVAAGGGNIIGEHGAGLVGQDGASIVAAGGGNILTISSGNLIQANGLTQGLGK